MRATFAMSSTNPQLMLNLPEGSVSFRFTLEAAYELQTAITGLMEHLKTAVAQGGTAQKPTPQKPMEYCYTGEIFLEVFCNPNIWSSPFAAKALITLRDDRIRLSTETTLTHLVEDLNQFVEQYG
jgi:hypothetical protein